MKFKINKIKLIFETKPIVLLISYLNTQIFKQVSYQTVDYKIKPKFLIISYLKSTKQLIISLLVLYIPLLLLYNNKVDKILAQSILIYNLNKSLHSLKFNNRFYSLLDVKKVIFFNYYQIQQLCYKILYNTIKKYIRNNVI